MRRRRYAEDTTVAVSRSRGEIDKLLRQWGAKGIQWSDDFENDQSVLRFLWSYNDVNYLARFNIELPDRGALEGEAIDQRSGKVSEIKLERLLEARGKQEHRLLLLWLKAALNAVASGLVSAETLFLPFLEGKDGKTVGEVAVPQLVALTTGNASRLLTAGKRR